MTDKTGGPAFPLPPSEHMYAEAGMSLRDYFAAKAMAALIEDGGYGSRNNDLAKGAYLVADAMLMAREK